MGWLWVWSGHCERAAGSAEEEVTLCTSLLLALERETEKRKTEVADVFNVL